MLRLKKLPREEWKKRFARYRRLFWMGALFLAAGAAAGVFFALKKNALPGEREFLPLFTGILTRSLPAILGSFLLGITVYAPAWQILSSLVSGFLTGYTLTALSRGGEALPLCLCGLYRGLFSWLFLSYNAFCTLVSLRLFTDERPSDPRDEEGRVFGGTLFNSVLFEKTLNPRFYFTYCLFFLAAALGCAGLAAAYAYGFSLT